MVINIETKTYGITKPIRFKGKFGELTVDSLIDTGASISMIPLYLAQQIGAWKTNDKMQIVGVNNQISLLPLGAVIVKFPMFNDIGGQLVVPPTKRSLLTTLLYFKTFQMSYKILNRSLNYD